MSHLQADPIDEIKAMIIKTKKIIIELGILLLGITLKETILEKD